MKLDKLEALIGTDAEDIAEFLQTSAEELNSLKTDLAFAFQHNDIELIRGIFHSIKPTAELLQLDYLQLLFSNYKNEFYSQNELASKRTANLICSEIEKTVSLLKEKHSYYQSRTS